MNVGMPEEASCDTTDTIITAAARVTRTIRCVLKSWDECSKLTRGKRNIALFSSDITIPLTQKASSKNCPMMNNAMPNGTKVVQTVSILSS